MPITGKHRLLSEARKHLKLGLNRQLRMGMHFEKVHHQMFAITIQTLLPDTCAECAPLRCVKTARALLVLAGFQFVPYAVTCVDRTKRSQQKRLELNFKVRGLAWRISSER